MTVATGVRRVALYLRVSSDDQAERGTIKTQADEIRRRLAGEEGIVIVGDYADDGVSGTTPLEDRPAGSRLLADARAGLIEEVWVYKLDRLGRDLIELAIARRTLVGLGIRLVSALEGEPDDFMFDIQSAVAANERRVFLRRTAHGMSRAAREGRYTGGIVPFGFRVEGVKQDARLAPDETVVWADRSAADLVRDIYERLALKGQSCRTIARDFNAAGIPTHYARDGRGVRGRATQGLWRAGRIRNLVVNPVYRGELQYGRRIDQRGAKTERVGHEITSAAIEGLVSPTLWGAAQNALAANRRTAKNTRHVYMLRGVIHCGICGLTLVGSAGNTGARYRCGGELIERGPIQGRCPCSTIRTDAIEAPIWTDIERFLRNPGDVLDELDGRAEREAQGAIAEAEAITLGRALQALEAQRKQATALNIRGRLSDADLDVELDRIEAERTALQARLAAVRAPQAEVVPQAVHGLLAEVRARLDAGLTDEQRQDIVRLLASVVVQTTIGEDGKKTAKALVTYRFPGVVSTCTGTGSSPQSTGIATDTRRPDRHARSPPGHPRVASAGPRASPPRTPAIRSGTTRCCGPASLNVPRHQ
jgi:site-specific DNA recombinase